MDQVKHVLIFSPHYASGGTLIPSMKDTVVLNGVVAQNSLSGAYSIFQVYDAAHPLQVDLGDVRLDSTVQDGNQGSEGDPPGLKGQAPTEFVDAGTCNTNVVPTWALGDSLHDIDVTTIEEHGSVPSCAVPAFGYPPRLDSRRGRAATLGGAR